MKFHRLSISGNCSWNQLASGSQRRGGAAGRYTMIDYSFAPSVSKQSLSPCLWRAPNHWTITARLRRVRIRCWLRERESPGVPDGAAGPSGRGAAVRGGKARQRTRFKSAWDVQLCLANFLFFSYICGIITLVPAPQATEGGYDTTEILDTKSFSGFTEELYVNEQQRQCPVCRQTGQRPAWFHSPQLFFPEIIVYWRT